MASRALLRALRLREVRNAPAAFVRRGGNGLLCAPTSRVLARSVANAAVPPTAPCVCCEKQILELRTEMLAENQRVWRMYEGLLDVNKAMLQKMGEIEAEAAKRQIAAVQSMVKISYRILASGGAFMMGMFVVISPLLKAAWQQETIDAMERKMRLEKVDAVIVQAKAPGEGSEGSASKVAAGPTESQRNASKIAIGLTSTDGKGDKGGEGACVSAMGTGLTSTDGKGDKGAEIGSVSSQGTVLTSTEGKGDKGPESASVSSKGTGPKA